jgi:twitching motility protein PilT
MTHNEPLDQLLIGEGLVSAYEIRPVVEEARRSGRPLVDLLVQRGLVEATDLRRLGVEPATPEGRPEGEGPLGGIDGALGDTPLGEGPSVAGVAQTPATEAPKGAGAPVGGVSPSWSVPGGLRRPGSVEPLDHTPVDDSPFEGPPVATPSQVAAPPPVRSPGVESPFETNASPVPTEPLTGVEAMVETSLLEPAGASAEPAEPVEKDPNLAEFLLAVVQGQGSDLHLTAGLPPTIRIFGELRPLEGYRKLNPKDLQEIVYSMLTQKQREIFEEHLELDVSYSLPGIARFRVNVFQQRDAVGSVMRLIPYEIKTVDTLGLPAPVKEFTRLRRGLVLVTGVTGSGKSTTLAALIDDINSSRAEHIMTVEDPIEFLHHHKKAVVNQREVGADTQTFASALKHVLRQDPDVILVGELRDLETISTALTAAETGHLVFATLHTQDAPQSIDRVIDVFPPHQQEQIRIQLAGTIAGIVSQQLVPKADGKGRAVAAEVLVATPAVRNLIREGKTHQIYTSMQAGSKFGMQVMDQHLAELVKKGAVAYEAALERAHHIEEFNRLAGKG